MTTLEARTLTLPEARDIADKAIAWLCRPITEKAKPNEPSRRWVLRLGDVGAKSLKTLSQALLLYLADQYHLATLGAYGLNQPIDWARCDKIAQNCEHIVAQFIFGVRCPTLIMIESSLRMSIPRD